MKKATRISLLSAALAAGLSLAGASRAQAQVRFDGSFPLPHGRISVGIGAPIVGAPIFSIGAFVPYGYEVVYDPTYGYGFVYGDQWISCRPYGSRFIVVSGRPFYGYHGYSYRRYGYGYPYGYSRGYGSWGHDGRRWDRRDDRRWDRRDDRRNDRRDDRRGDRFDHDRNR